MAPVGQDALTRFGPPTTRPARCDRLDLDRLFGHEGPALRPKPDHHPTLTLCQFSMRGRGPSRVSVTARIDHQTGLRLRDRRAMCVAPNDDVGVFLTRE